MLGTRSATATINGDELHRRSPSTVTARLPGIANSMPNEIAEPTSVGAIQPQWHEWDSSTFDAAKTYLGEERMNDIYPIRSFEIAGAPIAFGSDWPVDPLMPWYGIERAVTRTAEEWYGYNEMGPLNPWESITLKNAVKYYTLGSAYQLHMENKLGTITRGKFADMIVLDQNIFKVPIEKVDQTKVLTTIVNGKVVYKK